MSSIRKRTCIFGIVTAMVLLCLGAFGAQKASAQNSNDIHVIFTHDLHSYLEGYDVSEDGVIKNVGGMPRLSTVINEARNSDPDTLVLDAGDYPMGTLYQALFSEQALEYRMLSELKFDATTFGNHDFDYGSKELAREFAAAKANCEYYPDFLICNIDWTDSSEATQTVYSQLKDLNLKEYDVFERNGYKIGITGVLGYDALICAPTCELKVLDPIESVRATVNKMIAEENPDVIMVISHSGTEEDESKSEDEILAAEVPEIDFIVSGHTHTALFEPIKVGNTYICSCGCYGRYTGSCTLSPNEDGTFDMKEYKLISMDETIAEDESIKNLLTDFKKEIDDSFLQPYGYKADMVVSDNNIEFSTVDDVYDIHEEHNLGNIISDAYRWMATNVPNEDDNTVYVTVAPAGTIRGSYLPGDITVAKVYESFSLGSGADGSVGYPLVSLYLNGKELKTLCEVDASVSDLMNNARLYMSGLEFTYNPHRMILNKVTETHLDLEIMGYGEPIEIEDDKLYRVVTDMYSCRMLGAVTDVSYGLLSVVPKNADGSPVVNFDDNIMHDKNGNEIKAWVAIAEFMRSRDIDGDGIGNMPQYYVNKTDRKAIDDSTNIIDLIKNPNRFFFGIIGVVLLVLVLLFFVIKLIVFAVKKIISGINKSRNAKKS